MAYPPGQHAADEAGDQPPGEADTHQPEKLRVEGDLAAQVAAEVAEADQGEPVVGGDPGEQSDGQQGERQCHGHLDGVPPGRPPGRGADRRGEGGDEQHHGRHRHQEPDPAVVVGERTEVEGPLPVGAERLGEGGRQGQPDGLVDMPHPGAAGADAQRHPGDVRQSEEDDGDGLGRAPVGEELDDADDQTDQGVAEQGHQHREGGRPYGILEVQQPGGERGPARDEEGQHEQGQHPQQPEPERRGHIGAEAEGGGGAQLGAELFGEVVADGDPEAVPGGEREQQQKHQPAHRRSGDPGEQLPGAGHRPVAQRQQEDDGGHQRTGERDRQRYDVQCGIGLREVADVAVEADRTAGRDQHRGRDHGGERAAGKVRRARRPQAEGGAHEHGDDARHGRAECLCPGHYGGRSATAADRARRTVRPRASHLAHALSCRSRDRVPTIRLEGHLGRHAT